MKIVEIRQTKYGEVAYVFDEQDGKLYKLLVEDLTNLKDEVPLERIPRRRVRPVPMPMIDDGLEEDDLPPLKEEKSLVDKPRVAPKNIIPPHLRGVFIPQDQPGAAIERREVGG